MKKHASHGPFPSPQITLRNMIQPIHLLRYTCIFILLTLVNFNCLAQSEFEFLKSPDITPDTLYFPFVEDIQLIVINSYDSYLRHGWWQDQMYPRGGSWFMDHPEALPNAYFFRNREGEITQIYNRSNVPPTSFRDTGFLNTDHLSFNYLIDYSDLLGHLKIFSSTQKVGLINTRGEIVAPAIYDHIQRLHGYESPTDKLIIVNDQQFGLLDSNAQVIFPPRYTTSKQSDYFRTSQMDIDGENLKVFNNDRCGLISQDGEVLIDFQYDEIRVIHDSMYLALVTRPDEEVSYRGRSYLNSGYHIQSCVIFDRQFQPVTTLEEYEYILYYGVKQLIVKKDGKFGLLNHLGEVIIPFAYESLAPQDGMYYVRKAGKLGAYSTTGDLVFPCEFEQIQCYGQAIYATKDGLIGVYNQAYELIADHQFERRHWDMGRYILTSPNGSQGFVNHEKNNTYYQSPDGEIIKL